MQCISPIFVRSASRRDFVPCGKCNFCLQTKRFDWSFRLRQELKRSVSAHFLTMTYSDDVVPIDGCLNRRDVQLFTKRLRKDNSVPLRYYTVGEYGTRTLRPHYHSIMFNLDHDIAVNLARYWKLGNCYVGDVQEASINYVTKYVINRTGDYAGREPPFSLMSRRPGIGSSYLDTHKMWHRDDMRNYTQVNGSKARLPRFYKDKIFSDAERARMAVESVNQSDLVYLDNINRLSKFHADPYHYHDQCVRYAHAGVISKVNISQKF